MTLTSALRLHVAMLGDNVTILHLSDLQFGKNHRFAGIDLTGLPNPYDTLLARLWEGLQHLREDHSLRPDHTAHQALE
ncbi:MAG: hypothetical protein HZA90_05410 [Verrucomicrobia bacterium]|nr:hypothetical protein [Verrucomicrobiota bacterium]